MVNANFHSMAYEDYAAKEGVSATMLDYIRESPRDLRAYLDGKLKKETKAMSLGTLAHRAIFEPDTLSESGFNIIPETLVVTKDRLKALSSAEFIRDVGDNKEIEWIGNIKEAGEWYKAQDQKKPFVSKKEWEAAIWMRDNVLEDSACRSLLCRGHAEQACFVEDEHGTKRKSRFDYISFEGNIIPDLKSVNSVARDALERKIRDFEYSPRAAFYLDNANLAGLDKDHYIFIFVKSSAPYHVICYKLDPLCVAWGRMVYKADLQRYRNCIESGKWPGYETNLKDDTISLPDYQMRQISNLVDEM